jgi:hypothetical protein
MKIDDLGRMTITDVQTAGGDPMANARAQGAMNTWLSSACMTNPGAEDNADAIRAIIAIRETAEEVGLAVLEARDDEYGNVDEFKHWVVIESGFDSNYKIVSPDADAAILLEIKGLMHDIGSAQGDFFRGMAIDSPFSLMFGEDGLISLGEHSLSALESQTMREALEEVNEYLLADRAGEDTDGMFSDRISGIAQKLLTLKGLQDRILDRSLLPEGGIRFAF